MEWLDAYWHWAGSNIGALPAETLITAVAALVFQKPLRRLIALLRRDAGEAIEKAQADAGAARQIAADLYRHITGEDHPAESGG